MGSITLKNYQNRNKDKDLIKNLTNTISNLQKQLVNINKADKKSIILLDEINFSNKRLEKILTTKQKIDYELEIQEIYKLKLVKKLLNKVLPIVISDLKKYMRWETVPYKQYNKLYLKYIGNWKYRINLKNNNKKKYGNILKKICDEYNRKNLKVRPYLEYKIVLVVPIMIYINNLYHKDFNITVKIENFQKSIGEIEVTNSWSPGDYNELPSDFYYGSFRSWSIPLPSKYNLHNIHDIEIYLGRINKNNIKLNILN